MKKLILMGAAHDKCTVETGIAKLLVYMAIERLLVKLVKLFCMPNY